MKKSQFFMILAVLIAFVGIITLGGLGNAAASVDAFYWFPFVLNIPVYGLAVYLAVKAGNESEEG